jgi:hypothetical protein
MNDNFAKVGLQNKKKLVYEAFETCDTFIMSFDL